jgi:hypothetical protein
MGIGPLVVGYGTDEPFTGIGGYVNLLIEQHLGEG